MALGRYTIGYDITNQNYFTHTRILRCRYLRSIVAERVSMLKQGNVMLSNKSTDDIVEV